MDAPIRYPAIQFNGNGQIYRIKYSLMASRRLQEWGIKVDEAVLTQDEGWAQLSAQIAATACIEDGGKLKYAGLTPQQVDEAYDGDPDFADMAYLKAALVVAVSFRLPSAENSQAETALTI